MHTCAYLQVTWDESGNSVPGLPIEMISVDVGYAGTKVLESICLSVDGGEFVALLGASGCGKTTLLRALAGFVPITAGRLLVDGKDVGRLPPERRQTAMMFQSYALWPHMNVARNIGYGLALRKHSRPAVARRVGEVLELVGLSGFESRKVTQLSGGQRQRVALARALAVDPPILLLDEPLSNLDARIRHAMRHEIRSLQKKIGITTILVTHDQEEAMSMADRIAILNHGRIAQAGTPEEVYNRPSSSFVARFVGAENSLAVNARFADGQVLLFGHGLNGEVSLPLANPAGRPGVNAPVQVDGPMAVQFHGEAAFLNSGQAVSEADLVVCGVVSQSSYLGKVYRHNIAVGDFAFLIDHRRRLGDGEAVEVRVPAAALNLFATENPNAAAKAGG